MRREPVDHDQTCVRNSIILCADVMARPMVMPVWLLRLVFLLNTLDDVKGIVLGLQETADTITAAF